MHTVPSKLFNQYVNKGILSGISLPQPSNFLQWQNVRKSHQNTTWKWSTNGYKIQMYFSNDPAYFVSKHILKCQVIYLTSLKFINLFTNEKVCQVCLSGFLRIKRTFRAFGYVQMYPGRKVRLFFVCYSKRFVRRHKIRIGK